MKKIFLLVLILTMTISTSILAVVPGYENSYSPHKIADYTLEFLHSCGLGGTGTFSIFNSKYNTDDEVIEIVLNGCWTMNKRHIRQITHVNGIPIEQTKWAKYGGVIQHIGGNYEFPEGLPQKPVEEEPVKEQKEITVFINNDQVNFPDQKPVIIRGRTMVPVRAVFEHKFVQAEVKWDGENRTVTATDQAGRTIVFRIGDNGYSYKYLGKEEIKDSDVAPLIENNRTLLPLRALSESLCFKVDWLAEESKVDIQEKPGNDRNLMTEKNWEAYLKRGGKKL